MVKLTISVCEMNQCPFLSEASGAVIQLITINTYMDNEVESAAIF